MPSSYETRMRLSSRTKVNRRTPNRLTAKEYFNSWQSEPPLENIRLTPSGVERTDYTYANSGSYRSDRLNDQWVNPDMSRLQIHTSGGYPSRARINTLVSSHNGGAIFDSTTQNRNMTNSNKRATVRMKRLEVLASKLNSDDSDTASLPINSRHSGVASDEFVDRTGSQTHRSFSQRIQKSNNVAETFNHRDDPTEARSWSNQHENIVQSPINTTNINGVSTGDGRSRQSGPKRSSRISRRQSRERNRDSSVSTESRTNRLLGSTSTYVYNKTSYVSPMLLPDVPSSWQNKLESVSQPSFISPLDGGDGPGNDYDPNRSRRLSSLQLRTETSLHNTSIRNEETTRGWLARHIFGLEKPDFFKRTRTLHTRSNNISEFLSSDAEQDDTRPKVFSQSSVKTRARTSDHSSLASSSSSGYHYSSSLILPRTLSVGLSTFRRIRRICFEILALAITVLHLVVAGTLSLFRKLLNVLPSVNWKWLTDYPPSPIENDATIHPRLSRFQSEGQWSGSNVDEAYQTTQQPEDQFDTHQPYRGGRSVYGNCAELMGFFLFLLPLLLLLFFLSAPFNANETGVGGKSKWILPITDIECNRSVPLVNFQTINFTRWQIIRWRLHCLYERFVLTSVEPPLDFNKTGTNWLALFMSSIRNWSHSGYWSSNDSASPTWDGKSDRELKLQLAAFSENINRRLDQITKNLQSTGDQISVLALRSSTDMDELRSRTSTLEKQLNDHNSSWYLWQSQFEHELAALTGKNMPPEDSSSWIQSVLDATNLTLTKQFAELRDSFYRENLERGLADQDRVSELSLLFAELRHQLIFRTRRTENEMSTLKQRLVAHLSDQRINHTSLESLIESLHAQISDLSGRLKEIERVQSDSERLVSTLNTEVQRCSTNQMQSFERCESIVSEKVAVAMRSLSDSLTTQIVTLVNEALIKHPSWSGQADSPMWLRVQALVTKTVNDILIKETSTGTVDPSKQVVQQMIDVALHRFAADRTGMADFALESGGGSIIGTRCTRTYTEGASLFSIFGIPLARLSNSPRTILQPGNNPGDCWAFHGSSGQAVIRLSNSIWLKSVTLEHLPRSLAPNTRIDSAPREFSIKALDSDTDEQGFTLGTFVYDIDGPPLQTFPIQNEHSKPLQFIEFVVLNNYGHSAYTCVYRLRVHGRMAD